MLRYVVEFYSGDIDYRHTPVLVHVEEKDQAAFENFLRELRTLNNNNTHAQLIDVMAIDPDIYVRYWTAPNGLDGYVTLFPLDIYDLEDGEEVAASLDGWYKLKESEHA